jgi:ectoine hydroxylase-related dioxygenase (phytanoyl-CoA dioxygenase family)
MDWMVAVSDSEAAGGRFHPNTASAAHASLQVHGCVLLRGAFAPATIAAMHAQYLAQFGAMDCAAMEEAAGNPPPNRFFRVGDARYDIALQMTGAFGRPEAFANPLLLDLLVPLLGKNLHLNSMTAVVSHPGATQQHAHRDHPDLYFEPGVSPMQPIYAVNVAVPLIDIELATGPTGVWLGSHRVPDGTKLADRDLVAREFKRGDCLLLDYGTMHTGLANRGSQIRPIVYLVYSRPWFFDHGNHRRRVPLDLPLESDSEVPAPVRPLLSRAFSYGMYARWREADRGRRSGG